MLFSRTFLSSLKTWTIAQNSNESIDISLLVVFFHQDGTIALSKGKWVHDTRRYQILYMVVKFIKTSIKNTDRTLLNVIQVRKCEYFGQIIRRPKYQLFRLIIHHGGKIELNSRKKLVILDSGQDSLWRNCFGLEMTRSDSNSL